MSGRSVLAVGVLGPTAALNRCGPRGEEAKGMPECAVYNCKTQVTKQGDKCQKHQQPPGAGNSYGGTKPQQYQYGSSSSSSSSQHQQQKPHHSAAPKQQHQQQQQKQQSPQQQQQQQSWKKPTYSSAPTQHPSALPQNHPVGGAGPSSTNAGGHKGTGVGTHHKLWAHYNVPKGPSNRDKHTVFDYADAENQITSAKDVAGSVKVKAVVYKRQNVWRCGNCNAEDKNTPWRSYPDLAGCKKAKSGEHDWRQTTDWIPGQPTTATLRYDKRQKPYLVSMHGIQ